MTKVYRYTEGVINYVIFFVFLHWFTGYHALISPRLKPAAMHKKRGETEVKD
jgi:hypothetical protein